MIDILPASSRGTARAALGASQCPQLLEPLESRLCLSAAAANVFAQGSTVDGHTLGQWAQDWSQWVYSFPASTSPLRDATGQNGSANQPRGVFFLAGSDTPGTYVRDITIPSGTKVFFPVVSTIWITLPSDEPITIPEIRSILDQIQSANRDLVATVDGKPVTDLASHREQDPTKAGFPITLPVDNVFGADPGTYPKNAIDGVFLMTRPLSVGDHTIHFGGANDALGGFSLDVTYHITVVPQGQYKKDAAPPSPAATFSTTPVKPLVLTDAGGDVWR